jgi:homoserine O-acetyltransferase
MHRLKLASVPVGSDKRLADVDLAYTTHGRLDADGGNCIVLPTYYTGNDESYLSWIGPGCPFDSDRWYVVVPNMIGNSRSTARDARTRRGWDPRTDPVIGIADNVAVQRRLLEYLGVERVALVAGWSMGGLQAYEWAAGRSHPAGRNPAGNAGEGGRPRHSDAGDHRHVFHSRGERHRGLLAT